MNSDMPINSLYRVEAEVERVIQDIGKRVSLELILKHVAHFNFDKEGDSCYRTTFEIGNTPYSVSLSKEGDLSLWRIPPETKFGSLIIGYNDKRVAELYRKVEKIKINI